MSTDFDVDSSGLFLCGSGPHLNVSWAHMNLPKWHLDWFSYFSYTTAIASKVAIVQTEFLVFFVGLKMTKFCNQRLTRLRCHFEW